MAVRGITKQIGVDSLVMQRTRRESFRWRCLDLLDAARPNHLTGEMLLQSVRSDYPDTLAIELWRELDYLSKCDLLTFAPSAMGATSLELTRQGIDLVEYTTDCPPGIGRPAPPTVR